MGRFCLIVCIGLVLCSSTAFVAEAHETNCTEEIAELDPCLTFASGQESNPSTTCCTMVEEVGGDHPLCFCDYIGYGNISAPSTVNLTIVQRLPTLCNTPANSTGCLSLVNGTEHEHSPSSSHGGSRMMPGTMVPVLKWVVTTTVVSFAILSVS